MFLQFTHPKSIVRRMADKDKLDSIYPAHAKDAGKRRTNETLNNT